MNVICFGYNPWSDMWKRNQQLVAGLARESWVERILFVNPEVWVSAALTHPRAQLSPLLRQRWRSVVPTKVVDKITAVTPYRLPAAARLRMIRGAERVVVDRLLRDHAQSPFILLVNRPMEFAGHELRDLMSRAALRVFDWSDDFAAFDTDERERLRTEGLCEQALRATDVVLAVNDELGRRAKAFNANVHVVRNATDPDVMGQALDDGYPRAKEIADAKPPVVGYVGYRVADRLDVELVEYLAANRKEWTFAFVGPRVGDEPLADVMRRHTNVRVFDAVQYRELPGYFVAFDACILPNRVNEHTRGNDPIKIYDYLASGRPVVSTRTAGSEQFAGAIETASSAPEFLAALHRAITCDSAGARRRRLAVARENSWQARVDVVSKILRDAIG